MDRPKLSLRKHITRSDYLKLLGLKLLADRHNAALKNIVEAANEITGECEPDGTPVFTGGNTDDSFYGDMRTIDELIALLGLKVVDIDDLKGRTK